MSPTAILNATAFPFPDVKSKYHELNVDTNYQLTDNVALGFRYNFEPYRLDDFQWNGLNAKPITAAQAPVKPAEDLPAQAKPKAQEEEDINFPASPRLSKDVDEEISRLREQLGGLPDQVVSGGMRITNPEVMRIKKQIIGLAAESQHFVFSC